MKFLLSVSLFALLAICASTPVRADQLQLTMHAVNGTVHGGYYVGPNTGLLKNLTTGETRSIDITCDNVANSVYLGSSWGVKSLTLDQHLSARFGNQSNAHNKYLAAFWLTERFDFAPQNQWGDIQYAIWGLFHSSRSLSTAGALAWQNKALANITSVDASRFRILTPDGANIGQEMITTVPEPISMVLFGSGLLGSAITVRRRRRREQLSN